MDFHKDDMSLLALRILAEFTEFQADRKKEVASGTKTLTLAVLEVKNYGHGLGKALAIAEDLSGLPDIGMTAHVNRSVQEMQEGEAGNV